MADKRVITSLESRTRQLLDDHRRLTELCAELTRQCEALRGENRSLREQLHGAEAELSRMQLCEGLAGESRNRDKARARVNRLMREVDKCIALLSRPDSGPQQGTDA